MGLPVRLVLHGVDEPLARHAARTAFERIAALDRIMSDYRPDSELRHLERGAGRFVVVSADLFTVLRRAIEIAQSTDGAFDPTVAPFVKLWREARRTGRMPGDSALAAARTKVGWQHIRFDDVRTAIRLDRPGMSLDLGGIAKGYILQQALQTLRGFGVTRALVESGGDIVVGDPPPGRTGWTIRTEGAGAAFASRASNLINAALATSGASVQFVQIDGVRYSHVIDPRTGLGVTNPHTAWVIARDGATADALATAFTVLGPAAAGALLPKFPGIMVSLSTGEFQRGRRERGLDTEKRRNGDVRRRAACRRPADSRSGGPRFAR